MVNKVRLPSFERRCLPLPLPSFLDDFPNIAPLELASFFCCPHQIRHARDSRPYKLLSLVTRSRLALHSSCPAASLEGEVRRCSSPDRTSRRAPLFVALSRGGVLGAQAGRRPCQSGRRLGEPLATMPPSWKRAALILGAASLIFTVQRKEFGYYLHVPTSLSSAATTATATNSLLASALTWLSSTASSPSTPPTITAAAAGESDELDPAGAEDGVMTGAICAKSGTHVSEASLGNRWRSPTVARWVHRQRHKALSWKTRPAAEIDVPVEATAIPAVLVNDDGVAPTTVPNDPR